MGKKAERQDNLKEIIRRRNAVSIHDLASLSGMSAVTARRDVEDLVSEGFAENIRGMVFYRNPEKPDNYTLSVADTRNAKEKRAIGKAAAERIGDGELVIIDNGTTTGQMAAQIPFSKNATILCYNINVMMNLYRKPNINLIFCGGFFHPQSQMFECPESLDIIRRTRAAKVFVSAAGVHESMGVTCASEYELANKKEIIQSGMKRILLVDSSKFGVVKPWYVGELTEFETVITDKGIPKEWEERIRAMGVELVTV